MQIRYLLNGLKLNSVEKDYLEGKVEKVGKLLKNYSDNELQYEIEVDLDRKKDLFSVEMMIKTPHDLFRSRKEADTFMSATDDAQEAIKLQIRRNKDKVKALRERGSRSIKKKFTIDKGARF